MSTLIFMMLRLHTGSISGNTTQTQLRIQKREREIYTNGWTLDILLEIHTGGHTDGYTVGRTYRRVYCWTDIQTGILLDRQSDGDTDRQLTKAHCYWKQKISITAVTPVARFVGIIACRRWSAWNCAVYVKTFLHYVTRPTEQTQRRNCSNEIYSTINLTNRIRFLSCFIFFNSRKT